MMKMTSRVAAGLLLGAFFIASAHAQGVPQVGPGQVLGNNTAARAPAQAATITSILDRALGSTRGAIIERGAGGWVQVGPGATAGLPWVSNGTGADPAYQILGLAGGGCNAALTASNGGVLYSTATACAILNGTANSSRPLISGANAAPSWAAFSLPGSVTSGGIPYFSSSSAMASSALLAANAPVIGGGAGNPPSTVTAGTNNQAFMGNTGSAPGFRALVGADLPNPSASSLGGVQSKAAVASQWINSISTSGVPTSTQPAFTDISGQVTLAQFPSLAANTVLANITGSSATPTAATLTSLVDTICTTQGAVLYRNASNWVCLPPGSSGQVLQSGGAAANPSWQTVAGSGTVTSVSAGTGMSFTTITGSGSVAIDKATNANYYAAASNKVPTTDVIYPPNVAITYGTTTNIDFSTFNNGTINLIGNITTMNVSNVIAGKSGRIRFIQDATGSRTTVWNSTFKFAGGTTPSLTTTANAVDVLYYDCETSPATVCYASLNKDMR